MQLPQTPYAVRFAVYDLTTGRIKRLGTCAPGAVSLQADQADGEGHMQLALDVPVSQAAYYVHAGVLTPRPIAVLELLDTSSVSVNAPGISTLTVRGKGTHRKVDVSAGVYNIRTTGDLTVSLEPPWPYQYAEVSGTFTGDDGEGVDVHPAQADYATSVNAERDRRIDAGFTFLGRMFDYDDKSKTRIARAAAKAGLAMAQGVPGESFTWSGGETKFVWLDAANKELPMAAETCSAFGDAADKHEKDHVFAARKLKDTVPPPADYKADKHWP